MKLLLNSTFRLNDRIKLKTYLAFIFLILNSLLEIVSLGSIPLVINFFINPEALLQNYPVFEAIYPAGISKDNVIIYGLLILVIFFFIKNSFSIYFSYFERSFFNEIAVDIQKKIYDSYLLRDYLQTLDFNSAFIIRNFTTEVEQLRNYLRNIFLLYREIIVILSFLGLLLYLNFTLTIFLIIITSILAYFFYIIFQKSLEAKGKVVQEYNANIIQLLNYSIELIKEVKVTSKENYLRKIFFSKIDTREKNKLYHQIISILPRIILEFFIILLIFLVAVSLVKVFNQIDLLFVYLSFLAVAAIRVLPSMNIITNCISTFKFYSPSYEVIKKELDFFEGIKSKIYKNKKIINDFSSISLKNVSFEYKKGSIIFDNVSLDISRGDKILIQGASGSGKSTLINIILGLQKATTGNLIINDQDFTNEEYIFQDLIGYVPQDIYLIDDNIKSNIALFEEKIDEQRLNVALKISNSNEFVNNLPQKLDTLIGQKGLKLSGGQRQRLAIARSIYSLPKILILDEPTSSQDSKSNQKIIDNLLNDKDLTIIFISHGKYNPLLFNKIYEIKNKNVNLKTND
jgi:ATP-binding cassette, subfamily B, bacterial PglK